MGVHVIEFLRPGCRVASRTVYVGAGEMKELRVELEKALGVPPKGK